MATGKDEQLFDRIRIHAFENLSPQKRLTSNLYLDYKVYEKSEVAGPAIQNIVIRKPGILVFADDNPLAAFGHDCRYILYNANNGKFDSEFPARFPPFRKSPPETLKAFHQPVQLFSNPNIYHTQPVLRCPSLIPGGKRYAVLFAGMTIIPHLNVLEFCYRMLIDRYGFDQNNIYVLNYDGTLNTLQGPPATWPGDGTSFRIRITGQGTRAALQDVFNTLSSKLKLQDLLFVHTNGYGDGMNGIPSFLCAYPNWGTYMSPDFSSDLGGLPKYRSLIMMMDHCSSGGFSSQIIASGTANDSSIATSAVYSKSAYFSADGHWSSFSRDWIAAQIGHEPNGAALAYNPDTNADDIIGAEEAFNYALFAKNPLATPNFNKNSSVGGDIAFGHRHPLWQWWCWIVLPILQKYYNPLLPDTGFYTKIHKAMHELQKLILPSFDQASVKIHKELVQKVEAIVRNVFDAKSE